MTRPDSVTIAQLLSMFTLMPGLPLFSACGWNPILWSTAVIVFNVGLLLGALLALYDEEVKRQVPPRSP